MVRLEWTFNEFFADGGTTAFVDRVAASLGIHGSEIKIVSVYEGSLIINYNIFVPTNDPVAAAALAKRQIELYSTGQMNLGAPILDTSVDTNNIVQNGVVVTPGYKPIIITPTATNGGNGGSTSNGGSTTNNGGSSSSSSGSSGTTTVNYNVKTGTSKEFQEYINSIDYDPFAGIKVLTEEQKQAQAAYKKAVQQQKSAIEA